MTQEQANFLHEGNNHWFLSFCSNSHVQICNSLKSTLTQTSKKSIQALYRHFPHDNANVTETFLLVQKQQDCHNCGLLAMEFATDIFVGRSPIDVIFHVPQLRNHFIYCLESRALTPFLKI